MLFEESLWLNYIIKKYVKDNSLVLNIGSSTDYFVSIEQPYIKSNIIDELHHKGCTIKNIDLKQNQGVDLVGDVTDALFIEKIKSLCPDVIICSNLLEHLEMREPFCDGLKRMLTEKSLLIVTVPYSFPYHEDPIDTLFRPTLKELEDTFYGLKLIEGKIVDCGFFYSYTSKNTPSTRKAINFIKIVYVAIKSFFSDKKRYDVLAWNFKKISASCAVFKLN